MQDLRLIGVHEDGVHLILGDTGGNRYRVPLDEPLRAAVRRDRPRLGQLQLEMEGGLRPKEVQAMIRAGLTAEETAERAGWTVEKVRRYEGPILAEREHVALLGRQVRLRSPGGRAGGGMLGTRVDERLRSRQIDASAARWDSRRDHDGHWTVVVFFNAGGRQRQAEWSFDLLARSVQALDDEARWLSADEDTPLAGPIPAPHLRDARPVEVYDVEAEGGVAAPGRHPRDAESIDLMAAMRERSSRRGQRRRPRPSDTPAPETSPPDAPPLVPLPGSVDDIESAPGDDALAHDSGVPTGGAAPNSAAARPEAAAGDGESGDTSEQALPDGPSTGVTASDGEGRRSTPPVPRPQPRRPKPSPHKGASARKSGRPSVPSWDDIMFGKKSD